MVFSSTSTLTTDRAETLYNPCVYNYLDTSIMSPLFRRYESVLSLPPPARRPSLLPSLPPSPLPPHHSRDATTGFVVVAKRPCAGCWSMEDRRWPYQPKHSLSIYVYTLCVYLQWRWHMTMSHDSGRHQVYRYTVLSKNVLVGDESELYELATLAGVVIDPNVFK